MCPCMQFCKNKNWFIPCVQSNFPTTLKLNFPSMLTLLLMQVRGRCLCKRKHYDRWCYSIYRKFL